MTGFSAALRHVLKYEGGFVDHPDDPGGATNFGVTQGTYDAYRRDAGLGTQSVRLITRPETEVIYRERYWQAIKADSLPPALAFVAFDSAVNHGVGRTRGWLEATRDWQQLALTRLQFYVSLTTFDTFGKGWMRRLASVTQVAAELQSEPAMADRLLILFGADGNEVFRLPLGELDHVITRAASDRHYVRVETPES